MFVGGSEISLSIFVKHVSIWEGFCLPGETEKLLYLVVCYGVISTQTDTMSYLEGETMERVETGENK